VSTAAAVDIEDRRAERRRRDACCKALHRPRGDQRGRGIGCHEHDHRYDVQRERAENNGTAADVIR
jgi:hypothetical protein